MILNNYIKPLSEKKSKKQKINKLQQEVVMNLKNLKLFYFLTHKHCAKYISLLNYKVIKKKRFKTLSDKCVIKYIKSVAEESNYFL